MVQLLSFDTDFRPASQGIFLGKRIRTSPEALDFTGVSRLVLIIGYWHTFATIASCQGASLFDIGKALGHSTPATTGRIYTHLVDRTHEELVQRVSDALK